MLHVSYCTFVVLLNVAADRKLKLNRGLNGLGSWFKARMFRRLMWVSFLQTSLPETLGLRFCLHMNQARARSTKINFLSPETVRWGGGLPPRRDGDQEVCSLSPHPGKTNFVSRISRGCVPKVNAKGCCWFLALPFSTQTLPTEQNIWGN